MMTVTQYSIGFIRRYAPVIVFVFCLLALYILVSIGFLSVLGPILGGAIGGVVAMFVLFFYRSPLKTAKDRMRVPIDYRIPAILTSLYITSVISMYYFVSYERPLVHYVVFGLFAGYITYEIATGAKKRRVVPQLLVLAFFTYWSSQLAFPAGAYNPDVQGRALPAIREGLVQSYISLDFSIYLGYFIHVAETAIILDISPEIAYYLLSTVVLVGTLLILSILDSALPKISQEVVLYATLLFASMGWTLGRGMYPNKLNFFYPLILLVGLTALTLFSATSKKYANRWLIIGIVVSPALIFGHQFSSGAAMVLLGTIGIFVLLYISVLKNQYPPQPHSLTFGFVAAYILSIIGHPFHTGPLLGRASSLLLSVLAPLSGTASESSTASGGAGRYSELGLDLLLANTAGQAILFGLAVFGAAVVIRHSDWEYDFIILWMSVLSILLLGSLTLNARDFQPQRFYALLGLLGLNVCAGATLLTTKRLVPRKIGPPVLATIVCLFAIASLASPVAGIALSPFSDEVPHYPNYDTEQKIEGNEWIAEYAENSESVIPPSSNIPIEQVSPTRGKITFDEERSREKYAYSDLSNESGIFVDDGRNIGGRTFVFVGPPDTEFDGEIYSNGQTTVYLPD